MDDDEVQLPKAGGSYHKLIQTVVKDLFSAEYERLDKNVTRLCQANSEAHGRSLLGFLWEGDFYVPKGVQVTGRFERRTIHDSLIDEAAAHVQDATLVGYDKHQIQQILYKALSNCQTVQEMRNALPNCVTKLIPALEGIPRTAEPGSVFPAGSREREQFDKIAPKLDQYAAGKLFY